ncbi:MAG TPA: hypothetical protein VEL31_23855 [Ktedonobacteraceae bacterium]|nr:hypothetical protein [Ktedonobacteraceae bacterium]
MELENKYLVLKWSDITPALTPEQKVQLTHICTAIADWRSGQGKPHNKYVVINQDEPYFADVLKLMEAHQKPDEK